MMWLPLLYTLWAIASPLISDAGEDNTNAVIDECLRDSEEFAKTEDQYATEDPSSNSPLPSLGGNQFQEISPTVHEKELQQRTFECMTDRLNVTSDSDLEGNEKYQNAVDQCKQQQQEPQCDPSYPYRTIDGTCNNLMYPKWGSFLSCLKRAMPTYYEGASGFRKSVCGSSLPEPRDLSLGVHRSADIPEVRVSCLFVFFAQLLAHDISDIALSNIGNKSIECCKDRENLHAQCAPINIKPKDPFYSKYYNVTCFNFVRASLCDSCSVGKRNQMNEATSYIDGSVVYGSVDVIAEGLRQNDGTGKLVIQNRKAGELLPSDPLSDIECGSEEKSQFCFRSGDRRTNQHTPLMIMHTMFFREHNRIAEGLKRLNPEWDEERLYQEARKINIAQIQAIVYKEFLPLLLGSDIMTHYDLWVQKDGWTTYEPEIDATVEAIFNTAAYRLHSIVNGQFTFFPVDGDKILLRDVMSRSSPIYNDRMHTLVRGMSWEPAQKFDRHFSFELMNYLYREPNKPGLDLVAINIQRGRDNGLPPYTAVVQHFLNISIQSFDDLKQLMDSENVALLKKFYCEVRDIDLYVGLNNERVVGKGMVGPTTLVILGRQFYDWKFGDRFYFEHEGNFNKDQLQTVKQASLSKIICDNTKILSLQQNAMKLPSFVRNPYRRCSDIPGVKLSHWKE